MSCAYILELTGSHVLQGAWCKLTVPHDANICPNAEVGDFTSSASEGSRSERGPLSPNLGALLVATNGPLSRLI